MSQPVSPALIPLHQIDSEPVGGKAAGLARLTKLGLRVPDGFVVLGAAPGRLPEGLDEAYARLGGAVAVRSSALDEDGAEASFAGQYETVLGVQGAAAVREAVERCLASAESARAGAYRERLGGQGEARMAVVVQRMVDASAAGVLFTADPVSGRRDRVVVNAVRGLGEALVSGHQAADQLVLSREGRVLERELKGGSAEVVEPRLGRLLADALRAEERLGQPLDLEWAVGPDGDVYWLQARPITTLDLPGLDELDSVLNDPTSRLTTYNVSEVLPGVISPLGWDVFGVGLDSAMRDTYARAGLPLELRERLQIIVMFQGHMFLNVSCLYALGQHMFGSDKETMDFALAGHVLPPAQLPPKAPVHQRLANTARYVRSLFVARKRLEDFTARHGAFRVEPARDTAGWLRELRRGVEICHESFAVHVHCSMISAVLYDLLAKIYAKGERPSPEHHAAIAGLLAGTPHAGASVATTSLGLAEALDRLTRVIEVEPGSSERFLGVPAEHALAWLRDPASGAAGRELQAFLAAHGHRCIRELEIHSKDWNEDPLPLVECLQRMVGVPRAAKVDRGREAEALLSALPMGARAVLRWLLPRAQQAVVLREEAKSLAVRLLRVLKRGYLSLAEVLVADGRLPDADLLFFLRQQELERLLQAPDRALVRRAEHRRRLHPQKAALRFPRVFEGKPVPLGADAGGAPVAGDVRVGTPVSRGVVEAPARVVQTLEEAAAMKPGEILVAPYTDVGWTPYFSRAAGLATEVGSALSHGAVVAREYGLPAIVNLPDATRAFRTGDVLRLDGNTGELRRVR
jgi:pyruvate,water dikinase